MATDATLAGLEARLARLEDTEAVRATWLDYCTRIDLADFDGLGDVFADDAKGSAHWRAEYTFTATGRRVVNEVDAAFRFDGDGRVVGHHDRFSFWRWSRQALGPAALVMGSNPVGQALVRRKARARLDAHMRR